MELNHFCQKLNARVASLFAERRKRYSLKIKGNLKNAIKMEETGDKSSQLLPHLEDFCYISKKLIQI